jgi:hypothetical protein
VHVWKELKRVVQLAKCRECRVKRDLLEDIVTLQGPLLDNAPDLLSGLPGMGLVRSSFRSRARTRDAQSC